jgi:hypothetical protein
MPDLVMHYGATPDAADLGERLRGIDKLEGRATQGWSPRESIEKSIENSTKWWVGTVGNQEELVVGVAPLPGLAGWAAPWMLSTPRVFRGQPLKTFLRRTPEFVAECSEGHDVLFNLISEHNYASRRWLRHAGFSIKLEPHHVFGGFRFLEFIRVTPGGHYDQDT